MAMDSKKRIIGRCRICHKKLKIEGDAVKMPEHNQVKLPEIECPASGQELSEFLLLEQKG